MCGSSLATKTALLSLPSRTWTRVLTTTRCYWAYFVRLVCRWTRSSREAFPGKVWTTRGSSKCSARPPPIQRTELIILCSTSAWEGPTPKAVSQGSKLKWASSMSPTATTRPTKKPNSFPNSSIRLPPGKQSGITLFTSRPTISSTNLLHVWMLS